MKNNPAFSSPLVQCHCVDALRLAMAAITLALLSVGAGRVFGQESTANIEQRLGYQSFQLEGDHGPIHFYVSTGGVPLDQTKTKNVMLYLQGSGPVPLYFGETDRPGSSLMFDAEDFADYHYVVISKPGVPFFAASKEQSNPTYQKRTSLECRVSDVICVLDFLRAKKWVGENVLLMGHSEGADVAPWVAAKSPVVTRLVTLAPGGLSQMLELTLLERKKAERGEVTQAEAQAEIDAMNAQFRQIFADPTNWEKQWYGHSYLRWSTFVRPAMEAYVKLDIPVLMIAGLHDQNTPCESAEAVELEFIRLGKENLTLERWPMDHYFVQRDGDQRTDLRSRAAKYIIEWSNQPSSEFETKTSRER